MQIGRHLQKISRLESESHSGGVCLSSDIKEPEGFTPGWQGSDSLSDPSSEAGQAWAATQRLGMNSSRSWERLDSFLGFNCWWCPRHQHKLAPDRSVPTRAGFLKETNSMKSDIFITSL